MLFKNGVRPRWQTLSRTSRGGLGRLAVPAQNCALGWWLPDTGDERTRPPNSGEVRIAAAASVTAARAAVPAARAAASVAAAAPVAAATPLAAVAPRAAETTPPRALDKPPSFDFPGDQVPPAFPLSRPHACSLVSARLLVLLSWCAAWAFLRRSVSASFDGTTSPGWVQQPKTRTKWVSMRPSTR